MFFLSIGSVFTYVTVEGVFIFCERSGAASEPTFFICLRCYYAKHHK